MNLRDLCSDDAVMAPGADRVRHRRPSFARPGDPDPIAAMTDTIDLDIVTGSLPAPEDPQ